MVNQFSGIKYKLESSDKFDEYMKAIGIGMIARKVGNSLNPVIELVDKGDGTFSLNSTSTVKSYVLTFRLGEEFTQETLDGRKVLTVITQEGDNKLVEIQKGDKPTKIVREFTKDTLKTVFTIGDVVCTRVYKAVS